jgi:hypothetical protein
MSFATAGMTASREVQMPTTQEKQHFSNVGLVDYRQNFNTLAPVKEGAHNVYVSKNTPKQPQAWMGFSETKTGHSTRAARNTHVDIDAMAKAISSDFYHNLQTPMPQNDDNSINVKFASEVVNELQSHMQRQNHLEKNQERSDTRLATLESNVEYLVSSITDNDIDQRLKTMEKRISNMDTKLQNQVRDQKTASHLSATEQQKSLDRIQKTVKHLETNMSLKADKNATEKSYTKLSAELQETQRATLSIGKRVQVLPATNTKAPTPTPKKNARNFLHNW